MGIPCFAYYTACGPERFCGRKEVPDEVKGIIDRFFL